MGNNQRANQVRLNHELLIWAGFTLKNGVWSYPNGVTVDDGVPYFPEDETLCFKWLVPKIKSTPPFVKTMSFSFDAMGSDVCVSLKYDISDNEDAVVLGMGKSMALALCLAIQKLIRSR